MSDKLGRAAVIGLGSMGYGIALSMIRAGFSVSGYDPAPAALDRFRKAGGQAAETPAQAAQNADIVVCVVVNAAQTRAVLFGADGVADTMADGGVFISSATMNPELARALGDDVTARGRHYLDAPMSGGSAKAIDGELTVMASGSAQAFAAAEGVLEAMASKIYRLGDAAGLGSAFKMVNQHLAGVHIAAASEAMAFAARQGLPLQSVYDVITASAGNSWMFENRMQHVLDGDYTPHSSVEIFVKDLGIVDDMARGNRFPAPLAAAALQMFLAASGSGMGQDDDSSVTRVYAALSGASLPDRTA